MEQRALNLEQPKPKRKITRKSPKRRKILKYVKENPLADVNEVAAACGCSDKYVYSVVPRRKLKHKIGHEQFKKAAKWPDRAMPVTAQSDGDDLGMLEAWLTPEEYLGYMKGMVFRWVSSAFSGDTDIRKVIHRLMKMEEDIASAKER